MGKRVLLVDDEEDILTVVSARLSSMGYEVLTAADGQQALDVARRESPDLILLDLMLPKLDGYKVCRMLKFDKAYENIPIVIFSAKASDADKKMASDAGADGYLSKPFDLKVFAETLKKFLI
jgi:DNA-binding response OmpR family regulator